MNAMKFCGADGFPISRDPPEGGTFHLLFLTLSVPYILQFPISRDPPEGGTWLHYYYTTTSGCISFQFLGIPPKGEHDLYRCISQYIREFPISRDPPEGGTSKGGGKMNRVFLRSFQFLGIPPKGEL